MSPLRRVISRVGRQPVEPHGAHVFCCSVFPHIRTLARVIEKEPCRYCFVNRPRVEHVPSLLLPRYSCINESWLAAAAMYCFACFPSFTASPIASTYISLCSSLPASVVCHGWRAKTPSQRARARSGQVTSGRCCLLLLSACGSCAPVPLFLPWKN